MVKCEYVIEQGRRKGKKCHRYGCTKVDDKWLCNRHKLKSTQEERDEFLEEYTHKPVKKQQQKTKYSVFMITVNSNSDFQKFSTESKRKFKNLAAYIFSNNIKKFLTGEGDITDFESDYEIEVGEKQNHVHLHGIVKVEHNGFYQLQTSKLR